MGLALHSGVLAEAFTRMRRVLEAVGLQSPEGARIQRILKQDLAFYFRRLRRAVEDIGLPQLVLQFGPQPGAPDGDREATQNEVTLGRDVAAHTVRPQIEALSELLFNILLLSLDSAMRAGLKQGAEVELNEAGEQIWLREQSITAGIELPGPVAREAADFAAQTSARLVTGINQQTQERMAQLVARGIRDKLGVEGTGRIIRRELLEMSVRRSNLIATTEINDAMSEAMLRQMQRRGATGKGTVLSIRPCPICINNHRAGSIPVDQAFPSGHQRPPFHPDCACTLVTKRRPGGAARLRQNTLQQGMAALPQGIPTAAQQQMINTILAENPEFAAVKDALTSYTEGAIGIIQEQAAEAIKAGKALTPLENFGEALVNGIRHSPTNTRTVWRGLELFATEPEAAAVLNLRVGDTWQLLEPQSWSYSRAISKDFALGATTGVGGLESEVTSVLIRLKGTSKGINAEAFSVLQGQEEFVTNGVFRVVGREVAEDGILTITVEQTGVL